MQITSYTQSIHAAVRARKVAVFARLLGRDPCETLLDVGGSFGMANEFAPLYSRFRSVTVLNLDRDTLQDSRSRGCGAVQASACQMPFADGTFDWVFSNAVIEHVGNRKFQREFANEVRRVARVGYFITTPNRFFPIEPHTYLPFYQFLPTRAQKALIRFSPGFLREYEEIHLLSKRNFAALFPEATIEPVGSPVLAPTMVAYHKFAAHAVAVEQER